MPRKIRTEKTTPKQQQQDATKRFLDSEISKMSTFQPPSRNHIDKAQTTYPKRAQQNSIYYDPRPNQGVGHIQTDYHNDHRHTFIHAKNQQINTSTPNPMPPLRVHSRQHASQCEQYNSQLMMNHTNGSSSVKQSLTNFQRFKHIVHIT
ncbi:hypothetical protein FGO68_gene4463 [Halteria grandinella]|uniref:Uncharacterized protein n=1 Tax=Halteria grandinella TaxID=5974 RepID=A0A8J8NRX6_HALGN|nr:hypothetical protein FGO68_gene4463 [Halteria grandinella]